MGFRLGIGLGHFQNRRRRKKTTTRTQNSHLKPIIYGNNIWHIALSTLRLGAYEPLNFYKFDSTFKTS
jgi:hypothetical protein